MMENENVVLYCNPLNNVNYHRKEDIRTAYGQIFSLKLSLRNYFTVVLYTIYTFLNILVIVHHYPLSTCGEELL